jgi:hypothetical protein
VNLVNQPRFSFCLLVLYATGTHRPIARSKKSQFESGISAKTVTFLGFGNPMFWARRDFENEKHYRVNWHPSCQIRPKSFILLTSRLSQSFELLTYSVIKNLRRKRLKAVHQCEYQSLRSADAHVHLFPFL